MIETIFRISDETEMSSELLQEYIEKNKTMTEQKYMPLWKAYSNDYDIFHARDKASWKPDHRLAVNFAQYIVETFEGFFLGNPIKISSTDERVHEYVNVLDAYNDQDDGNAELSRTVSIFGRAYEMYYTDEYGQECIAYLSPMGSFIIYDESIKPVPRYFVRYYTDSNGVERGSISDESIVRHFIVEDELTFLDDGEPHNFQGVPAAEYIQNQSRTGIFENVLCLIDEYNNVLSEKANDVDYFADAYLSILGAQVDEKTIQFMRDNRVINFGGKSSNDITVEFLQKPNGDTTQENLLSRLENLIFTVAMVVNISEDKFGTSSGIALRYKLLPMLNLMKAKERKFVSGMNRRYKILFSNPVSQMRADAWTSLEYDFTANVPVDILSEAQAVSSLTGLVSKHTQLRLLSCVSDVEKELQTIDDEDISDDYMTDYPTARTQGGDGNV